MTHAEKIASAMLKHAERARCVSDYAWALADLAAVAAQVPVDMVLHCPECHAQHVDEPERSLGPGNTERLDWDNPPHRSHLCHTCGHIWRPADVPTNGVALIQTRGKNDS